MTAGTSGQYTPPTPVTEPERADLVCAASFAQRRLWFLQQVAPTSSAYNISTAKRLAGAFSVRTLEDAVTALVSRHESLRTTFAQEAGEPVQVLHPSPDRFPVTLVELDGLPADDQERRLREFLGDEAERPFDLERGPLLRVSVARLAADEHVLSIAMHHIISDGWSMSVLFRELDALYLAARRAPDAGRDPERLVAIANLEPLPIQYADYALWQREWLSGEELARQERYWLDRLSGELPRLELPTDRRRPAVQRGAGSSYWFTLSAELSESIRALSRREGATLFMTLLAAYEVLLQRYTGQDDFVIGTPIAGRTRSETEGLIGFFVNTLAIRSEASGALTFSELLSRVRADTLDAYAHQDLPFERLVELLQPERDRSYMPVFQTMFVLQNAREADGGGATFGGLPMTGVFVPIVTSKFDLQLTFSERQGVLTGAFLYDTDLFDAATIARMAGHLVTLLEAIVESCHTRVRDLPLLPAAERRTLLDEWAGRAVEYPRDALVHDVFTECAQAMPDAVAATAGDTRLTYAELDARSTALAAQLQSLGIGPGVRVALCVDRSLGMLVAILAVLKTGAAYVPIDPHYPADRVAFMLADAASPVVLAQSQLVPVLQAAMETGTAAPKPRVIIVRDDGAPAPEWKGTFVRPLGATATSPAYVMYTSGSTGRPKGVVVPHRAIVRLVRGADFARLDASQVMLGFAPISFDASTFEIWGALLNGARIALCPPRRLTPVEVAEFVEHEGVTIMWLTAALFQQVVDVALPRLRNVRQLLAGGDVLPLRTVRRVLEELPDCRLINGYGPTENTTFTCCHPITRGTPTDRSIPIGRPIANSRVYILDASLRPVPIGVPGELFAGGDGVALGYLDRPQLTEERFVADPFANVPGARMYRTGDRARWLADGTIEFLGRFDNQIKLRGFRVEPGEIEAVLGGHPAVRECAVVVRRETYGETRLVAYYAVRDGAALTPAEARTYLTERVPEYMVPAAVLQLPHLPVGPTGKVDRKALPAPDASLFAARKRRAPRTTLEHELAHIWASLLPGRDIGIDDDFFELGGHSLLAARMLYAVEQVRGQRVPLAALFEGATIERLAARLEAVVDDDSEPRVVVLQEGGRGTPFAFVHGDVRGGGWYCRRLAPLLGEDTPLIVLPTLHASRDDAPRTVEAMAAAHVASLRTVQPSGPYRIGGFCTAGLVAFEMARQLEAAGERVERLVLVDTTGINVRFRPLEPVLRVLARGATEDARLERRAALLRELRYYSGRWRKVRRMSRMEQLRWFGVNLRRRLPLLRAAAAAAEAAEDDVAGFSEPVQSSAEFMARPGTRVLRFQERAGVAYVPRTYSGAIDLIWASDSFPRSAPDQTNGWSRVSPVVRARTVESVHVGLITYNLPALAAEIRACLDSTVQEHGAR